MIQLNNKYILSAIASLMIVGCGSSGTYENSDTSAQSNSGSNTQNSNNGSNTNTAGNQSSGGTGTSAPQCAQSLQLTLKNMTIAYGTGGSYNYKSQGNESDDGKGSGGDNDSKGSRDSDNGGDKDSKGSGGDGDSKGSGGDEGKGSGGGGSHNQGRACAQCHSRDFASGATVFTTLNAGSGNIAAGYKIQLGNAMVYTAGRGDGNSHLNNFSGGNFTANVIDANGNIVNSSAANSHDSSRLDCNRCHTSGGAAGAPGRIVNYTINTTTSSTPVPANANASTCVSFSSNVMPILTAKCKSCHGSNGRFSVSSANGTYANIGGLKSPITAGAQYLIDKGSNSIGHGGGSVISTSSAEYKTIKAWINEGALNN